MAQFVRCSLLFLFPGNIENNALNSYLYIALYTSFKNTGELMWANQTLLFYGTFLFMRLLK